MEKNKKSALELLKSFPSWQILVQDLQEQVDTLHDELTVIDYWRDNRPLYTLDDIKRAELSILNMLINLPDTLINDLESVISVEEIE